MFSAVAALAASAIVAPSSSLALSPQTPSVPGPAMSVGPGACASWAADVRAVGIARAGDNGQAEFADVRLCPGSVRHRTDGAYASWVSRGGGVTAGAAGDQGFVDRVALLQPGLIPVPGLGRPRGLGPDVNGRGDIAYLAPGSSTAGPKLRVWNRRTRRTVDVAPLPASVIGPVWGPGRALGAGPASPSGPTRLTVWSPPAAPRRVVLPVPGAFDLEWSRKNELAVTAIPGTTTAGAPEGAVLDMATGAVTRTIPSGWRVWCWAGAGEHLLVVRDRVIAELVASRAVPVSVLPVQVLGADCD